MAEQYVNVKKIHAQIMDAVETALEVIETENAVEIVRCKDCIGKAHWYKNDYGFTICGLSGLFVVEDKDFCSYGERREENA